MTFIFRQFDHFRSSIRLFALIASVMLLAACQGAGGNRAGASLSIDGIEGVPKSLQEALRDGLERGAQRHGLSLDNGTGQGNLHLRGYLTGAGAQSQSEGAKLVWDFFDAQENRIQRITSTLAVKSGQKGLDGQDMAQLAEASMGDIAHFLKD